MFIDELFASQKFDAVARLKQKGFQKNASRLQKCCLQKLNLQPLLVKQINTKFASTKNDLSDKRPK